jgi:hypothetical protein
MGIERRCAWPTRRDWQAGVSNSGTNLLGGGVLDEGQQQGPHQGERQCPLMCCATGKKEVAVLRVRRAVKPPIQVQK